MSIKKLLFMVLITLILLCSFSIPVFATPISSNGTPDYSLVPTEYNYDFSYPKSEDFNDVPSPQKVCLNGFFINQDFELKYYEFIAYSDSSPNNINLIGSKISFSVAPLYVNNVGNYSYTYVIPCFHIFGGDSNSAWNGRIRYNYAVYDVATDTNDFESNCFSVNFWGNFKYNTFNTVGLRIDGYAIVGSSFYAVHCGLENSCIGMYFPLTEFISPYSYKSSTANDYLPFESNGPIAQYEESSWTPKLIINDRVLFGGSSQPPVHVGINSDGVIEPIYDDNGNIINYNITQNFDFGEPEDYNNQDVDDYNSKVDNYKVNTDDFDDLINSDNQYNDTNSIGFWYGLVDEYVTENEKIFGLFISILLMSVIVFLIGKKV